MEPGILGPKAHDLRSYDPGTGTLEQGTLTPGTLGMRPWDPATSNWLPPQILLNLYVKKILIARVCVGIGMCGHVCQKSMGSNAKIKCKDSFFSFLFQK